MLLSVKWKATPGRKRQSSGTEWRMQVLAFVKIRDNAFFDFSDNLIYELNETLLWEINMVEGDVTNPFILTIDNNREYNELVKQYEADHKQYEELLLQETDNVNDEIDKIEKKLWKDYNIEEIDENIDTYQDLVNDLKKINDLTSQIDYINVTDEDYDTQITELTDSIKEKHELISRRIWRK